MKRRLCEIEEELVLTSRDFEVFKLVNKFGLIEKKVLYEYFCDSIVDVRNSAFLKRLRKLKRNGYLKSYTRSYGLGYKGKLELVLRGIDVEYSEDVRKEYIKKTFLAAQIILDLNYKNKMSRIKFINDKKMLMIPNGENGYKLIENYESQKLLNQNLVDYIKAASN